MTETTKVSCIADNKQEGQLDNKHSFFPWNLPLHINPLKLVFHFTILLDLISLSGHNWKIQSREDLQKKKKVLF